MPQATIATLLIFFSSLSFIFNSSKSLKYSLACPDVPVWGLDRLSKGDEVWLAEGLFDLMALEEMGKKPVSCSSAMWSGLQLYQLLEKKPSAINIFSDNDEVGLRTSGILKSFFEMNNINCKIFISNFAKDPAEHYFQKNKNIIRDFIIPYNYLEYKDTYELNNNQLTNKEKFMFKDYVSKKPVKPQNDFYSWSLNPWLEKINKKIIKIKKSSDLLKFF